MDANPDVMQFTEDPKFFRRQNNCLKINNPNLPDGLYCVSIGAIKKGSSETISNFTLFDFRIVTHITHFRMQCIVRIFFFVLFLP